MVLIIICEREVHLCLTIGQFGLYRVVRIICVTKSAEEAGESGKCLIINISLTPGKLF